MTTKPLTIAQDNARLIDFLMRKGYADTVLGAARMIDTPEKAAGWGRAADGSATH